MKGDRIRVMLATIQPRSFSLLLYKTIILPVVLYRCESWSLREGQRLRVFEKRKMMIVFRPKRDKLHNEELRNLHSSPSIIRMIKSRRMIWAGHVKQMGEERNVIE
jgi:hypothetical protein